MARVVIVEYGTGNVRSIQRALDRTGAATVISSDPADLNDCEKIILPGVGHFGKAISRLKKSQFAEALHENVIVKRKPVLGICLGMELMAKRSAEGDSEGLGWIDGEYVKFAVSDKLTYKVPHIGWNQVRIRMNSALMEGIEDLSEFYFLHSYHFKTRNDSIILNETTYEQVYPSAIEQGNIFGVQYHPEKSFGVGARLLQNFVDL